MHRPGIWVGLIGFDILRVRRGCEIVLVRWQDRLALLLMALIAVLAAATVIDRPPGPAAPPALAALVALLLGASVAVAHEHRLEGLARRSIAAPLALAAGARAAHLAASSMVLLLLALAAARASALGIFAWPVIGLAIGGWAFGTFIGAAGARYWRERGWRPAAAAAPGPLATAVPASGSLLAITLRTQLPFRSPRTALLAAFALGAGQAVVVGAWARTLNPFAGGMVAATAAFAALLAVARVPAGPCRFGSFAGVPIAQALAANLAAPSTLSVGALLGALVHVRAEPDLVWIELGCGLILVFVTAFRVLHYRLDPKPRADRLMQLQLALLAMAAFGLPPLAPLIVIFRAVTLYRANRRAMWSAR